MKRLALVVVVVVVCGCGGGGGDDGGDDTGVEDLRIRADGAALVVGQDGAGAWQQLTVDGEGFAHLTVTSGFYGVISFCPGGDASGTFATSFEDVTLFCRSPSSVVEITGTTTAGVEVYSGYGSIAVADEVGTYALPVDAGVHDVFAVLPGAPSRVLVRRGVDASADVVLDLPVDLEGLDMQTMTPLVTGDLADETVVYSDLNTASGRDYVSFGGGPTSVPVPPQSMLVDGDHPAIGVSTRSAFVPADPWQYQGCTTQLPLSTVAPTLQLPQRFSATVDATHVMWAADPAVDWESSSILIMSLAEAGTSVRYVSSPSWHHIAVAGEPRVPLPDLAAMPGWTAGLTSFAAGSEVRWDVSTYRGVYYGAYLTCGAADLLVW
jgi:hypothetical protein